jgi:hypothetical protein
VPLQYSEKLITELIRCFKEEDGVDITPEEANEYLNSMAKLFLAFAGGRSSPSHRLSEAGGTPAR